FFLAFFFNCSRVLPLLPAFPTRRSSDLNSWTAPIPKYDAEGERIYVDETGARVDPSTPGAMPAYQLSMDTYTAAGANPDHVYRRSEEHTSELQSRENLVCRLLHEKKKNI